MHVHNPALRRWKQEDHKIRVILSYPESFKANREHVSSQFKQKKKKMKTEMELQWFESCIHSVKVSKTVKPLADRVSGEIGRYTI